MFNYIYISTLKVWFKKPIYYLFILAFMFIAGVAFIGNSGALDGEAFNGVKANSSFEIHFLTQYFNKFLMFLIPAIIGGIAYEDFKTNAYSIVYSYPIQKTSYLMGKFFGGVTLILLVVIFLYVGIIIAELLPIYQSEIRSTFRFSNYLKAFGIYSLPNMFLYGFFTFYMVIYWRNYYLGFILILCLFIIQNITQNLFDGNGEIISLLDPFGSNSFEFVTSQWNKHQRNTLEIPIIGSVLYNRLFWGVLCLILGLVLLWKHRFRESGPTIRLSIFKNLRKQKGIQQSQAPLFIFPNIQYDFGVLSQWKVVWHMSRFYVQTIIQSKMFLLLVVLGLLAVLFAIGRVTNSGAITVLPTTNVVLTIPAFFFSTIIMFITFMYGGFVVNSERKHRIDMLVAASPVKTSSIFSAKLLAIIQLQFILLTVMLVAGIVIQIYNGYYVLQLPLYLLNLFGIQFIGLLVWAITALIVHTVIRNTYVGIFILLLLWIGVSGLNMAGVTSRLLLFNFSEPLLYSDVSGYNGLLSGYFLVKFYWLQLAIVLLFMSYLLFVRGNTLSLKDRLQNSIKRVNSKWSITVFVAIVVLLFVGFKVGQGLALIPLSEEEEKTAFEEFKKNFERYNTIIEQPTIVDIELKIDILSKYQKMFIDGRLNIQNKTSNPIDTLLIKCGFNEISTIQINRESTIISEDGLIDFRVIRLEKPLMPKDTMAINFTLKSKPVSIFYNRSKALKNGTFIKNDILPRFGYFLNDTIPIPEIGTENLVSYHQQGADLVNVHTILSTSEYQQGIAPGKLIRQWKEKGRNYFEYKTDAPTRNSLSFHAGDFVKNSFQENEILLNIYNDKKHHFNNKTMRDGFFSAVKFNTKYFGQPLHNAFNVIEFPMTEGTYATLMGTSIPASEMRFIANNKIDEGIIDLSFYVIAHEMTHHWFGKQMTPANSLGATLLTEGITEYVTLKIYEESFGKAKAKQFLEKQHQRYWEGSFRESEKEPPLSLARPEQQYITYGKAAVALNSLGTYIGHHKLLNIIGLFFAEHTYSEVYPTSLDFIDFLKEQTDTKWHSIIIDLLEKTTYYTLSLENPQLLEDHEEFRLSLNVMLERNDRNEMDTEAIELPISFSVYDENDALVFESKESLKTGEVTRKEFILSRKPYKIIVDQQKLLIQKDRENSELYLY